MVELELSRDQIVTLAQAIEEFRDESSGPHLDINRHDANQLRKLLHAAGDRFVLYALEDSQSLARAASAVVEAIPRVDRIGEAGDIGELDEALIDLIAALKPFEDPQ